MTARTRAAGLGLRLAAGLGLLALPLLALAWHEGGREPTREIVMPVTLPEKTQ